MSTGPRQANDAGATSSAGIRNHAEWPLDAKLEPDSAAVERELKLILASPFFHASKRSQQFLNYVVQYRLNGHEEHLKERTIGSILYNRPADYATGDDSVVRVQAGEVRRRLEQYYKDPPSESMVHIELPLGSYSPEIYWSTLPLHRAEAPPALFAEPIENPAFAVLNGRSALSARHKPLRAIGWVSAVLLALAALASYGVYQQKTKNILSQFWAPVFASSSPVLVCLPKPIFYRPSLRLFKRNEKWAGEFDQDVDRENGRPHLQPDDLIRWGDMVEWGDFGVSKGDVKAAFRLSNLLIKMGKPTELKIGTDYGWDDLRHAPAVILGAFSNESTMKITSGLHFAFAENVDKFSRIQEQGGAGRAWFDEVDPHTSIVATDYGLVTRLVNSSTGQFVVDVAGITAPGSEAAGEVAGSSEDLMRALRNAPPDWSRKNVQIVVKTTVTDSVAGPPQVVAVYFW
jgi:hypothetical protein